MRDLQARDVPVVVVPENRAASTTSSPEGVAGRGAAPCLVGGVLIELHVVDGFKLVLDVDRRVDR